MIAGRTIGLRAIETEDLATLRHWRNRPELRQYFRENRELNDNQQMAWFERTVLGDPHTRMFGIENLETRELVGACGLCGIDWTNGSAEVSLYIGHHGLYIDKTFAPDTLALLTAYADEGLRLHRLWAEVYDFDTAKKVLLLDHDFEIVGVIPEAVWHQRRWHKTLIFNRKIDIS